MQTTESADSLPFDIVLRDGSTLALRPATATDVAALCAFFEALSPASRYYRFFSMACPGRGNSGAFGASERGRRSCPCRSFLDSGYRTSRHIRDGVVHIELSLEPTLDHLERAAQRSQVAAAASMKPFFEPRAVAVIGANRQRGKIGAEILHNLQASGFTGK